MNIQRNDQGRQPLKISITLEPADYLKKYESELQNLLLKRPSRALERQNAHLGHQ